MAKESSHCLWQGELSDGKSSHCLWQGELKMSHLIQSFLILFHKAKIHKKNIIQQKERNETKCHFVLHLKVNGILTQF